MQRESGDPEPADEFDRIVAGWRRERSVPGWPDDPDSPPTPDDHESLDVPDRPATAAGTEGQAPRDAAPGATSAEPAGPPAASRPRDDDHYTPPEPPPLPPVGPPALVGLGLLALGLVLIGAPWWIGVPDVYGLPLGLVTLASGLGWLVLRLWPDPPTRGWGDGEDDGAVL